MSTALRPLTCTISRPIKRRVLIGHEHIDEIYQILLELSAENLRAIASKDRHALSALSKPQVRLKLSDQSSYEEELPDYLFKIKTSKNRIIDSIELRVGYGMITCSIDMEANRSFFDHVKITVSGPEDKAQHIFQSLENIITRDRDATVILDKVNLPIATLITFFLASWSLTRLGVITYLVSRFGVATVGGIASIVGPFVIFSIAWSLDEFRKSYLRKVAFMWGEDLHRYKIANAVARTLLLAFPAWFLGNVSWSMLAN